MKVAQVAVYLDFEQVKLLRWDVQEAVLAADEDLEVTMQINDVTARRLAREEIAKKRDIHQEALDELNEAYKKLNRGEFELRESN
ncbi:MAG: hypothetical protein E6212_02665 [Actinomyces sp.]|nr:hypothetical protein [Actinomyces sp.]